MADKILTWLMDSQSGAALVGAFFGAIFAFLPAWLLQVRDHRRGDRQEQQQRRREQLHEIHRLFAVLARMLADRQVRMFKHVVSRSGLSQEQLQGNLAAQIVAESEARAEPEGSPFVIADTADRLDLLLHVTKGYERYAAPMNQIVLATIRCLDELATHSEGRDADGVIDTFGTNTQAFMALMRQFAGLHMEAAAQVRDELRAEALPQNRPSPAGK